MSLKSFFENNFEEFSDEVIREHLNDRQNGISERYVEMLLNFIKEKLNLLTSKMQLDIFSNGTVYTGSAGLGLYYFMRYIRKNKPEDDVLKIVLEYLDLKSLKGRRISFLCGDAGPLALATIVSYKLGTSRPANLPDYKALAQRLLDLISLLKESPDELLYGGAGYLYALLFVNKYIRETDVIPSLPKHIEKVIASIIQSGKLFSAKSKSESPLLWQWHEKIYLGAAHGVAGILYILLQAHSYINHQDMHTSIKPTLDWLALQQFPSGNFPSSLGSSSGDRLVQWCHGAPGFVPLFLLAYQIFKEEAYLKIALQCGEVIWQRGLCTKGYSICHGVSGNAYSFLYLYQTTKDPLHLYRACRFMEWCVAEKAGTELHTPDRPASLFEGLLGRLYLAEDIIRPDVAKFPAFTL